MHCWGSLPMCSGPSVRPWCCRYDPRSGFWGPWGGPLFGAIPVSQGNKVYLCLAWGFLPSALPDMHLLYSTVSQLATFDVFGSVLKLYANGSGPQQFLVFFFFFALALNPFFPQTLFLPPPPFALRSRA